MIYAKNETHQWARTIAVYPSNPPTADGQMVTLTSNGWEMLKSPAGVGVFKVVKSVDDLDLSKDGALVRGASIAASSYAPKVTVYWSDFVGFTDNIDTSKTYSVGDNLTIDASGKFIPTTTTGDIVVGVVSEAMHTEDDGVSGIDFVQIVPYKLA